ncbi:MAG: S8 family serine peptidase [Candidatus Promineifilaceae bacterium]
MDISDIKQNDLAGQIWIALGVLIIFWLTFSRLANWLIVGEQALHAGPGQILPGISYALAIVAIVTLYGSWFANRPKRLPRYAAVLRSWVFAALFVLCMLPIHFFPPLQSADLTPWQHLIQFVALTLFLIFLFAKDSNRVDKLHPTAPASWLPWLFAPLLIAAWVYIGVWGSVLETIVSILLSLLFGYAVGELVRIVLLPAIKADSRGAGWDFWLCGWAVGGILSIMGTAFGAEGQSVYLALVLPFVGWLGVGLMQVTISAESKHPNLARLVGLVTAAVMISADVDELSVLYVQNPSEGFLSLFESVAFSILLTIGLAALFWLFQERPLRWQNSWPIRVLTLGAWVALGWVALQKPNSGFYGDQLFVIMASQADLSAASNIEDVDQRREFVYQTLVAHAETSQADIWSTLDMLGAEYQPYYLSNAIAVRGGFPIRLLLSTFSSVDRVIADPVLRPLQVSPIEVARQNSVSAEPDRPPNKLPWGLSAIEADRVWDEFDVRGAGVVIGQSDSGVQWDHPELFDSYRGGDGSHDYNWLDAWEGSRAPYDAGGHGTHTLGSIVGDRVGVAPDATWFGCANLVRNFASPSLYLDCMQFMLAPYPFGGDPLRDGATKFSADILNNSWGCPAFEGCDATSLQAGTEALRAAGIFVVASAGNSGGGGCETVTDPIALYDASFTVGAYEESGELAYFSSRGPVSADGSRRTKPDIIAPGVNVISAYPGNRYKANQGTSMAGPHVAGVVALIWSANPALRGNINATELILTETAVPYDNATHGIPTCGDTSTPNNATGHGYLNAYNAVKTALQWR